MINKPASDNRGLWFVYRIRRKLHVLRKNGTVFSSVSRQERLNRKSGLRRRRSMLRRRRLRHLLFPLRVSTRIRYNQLFSFTQKTVKSGHEGFSQLSAQPVSDHDKKTCNNPAASIRYRFQAAIRLAKILRIRGARRRKISIQESERTGRKKFPVYRKLRYLMNTGKLFRGTYSMIGQSLRSNFSFLGNKSYLIILLNSTFIFILAYLLVFVIRETTIAIAASSFKIKAVVMYYDVEFLIRGRDWMPEAVKVVFSAGPLICLFWCLTGIIVFSLVNEDSINIRLFLLWVILQTFTQSVGEVILGSLLNQGVGWVLAYLYYSDTAKLVVVVGALIAMVACGLVISQSVLLTGKTYFNHIARVNRMPFLFSQILLPFLIGIAVIAVFKGPVRNEFELMVECSMILIILPAILSARYNSEMIFDEEPRIIRINWYWIGITFLTVLIFRFCFWKGIRI